MNLGTPYSESPALRGVVPLHTRLQPPLSVVNAAMDLVYTGHALNQWIPIDCIEFLVFDMDRVLWARGLWWIDHFFYKAVDLNGVFGGMIRRLGYKRIKWVVGNKTDACGVKNGEVYHTALLQKPPAAGA